MPTRDRKTPKRSKSKSSRSLDATRSRRGIQAKPRLSKDIDNKKENIEKETISFKKAPSLTNQHIDDTKKNQYDKLLKREKMASRLNKEELPEDKKKVDLAKEYNKDYTVKKKSKKRAVKRKMDIYAKVHMIRLAVFAIVGAGVIIGIYFFVQSIAKDNNGFISPKATIAPQVKSTQVPKERRVDEYKEPSITPNPEGIRDISFGAKDIEFKERQINQPGIFDTELLFSAGTGSLDGEVLTKLYLYNLDTHEEELITESQLDYMGEIYQTYANHKWLIWLDTDKGINNRIYVMNRATSNTFQLRNCENGQPKLRLYGDILVWMEQVDDIKDELYMVDLTVQEDLTLFDFTDKATYGVSAPCIYGDTIVWAGPDDTQSEEDRKIKEHSGIYYQYLVAGDDGRFPTAEVYLPGTYVHEPLYNGDVFVWLDSNKSRESKLYLGRAGEQPIVIDKGITTYSIGEGMVVYGKNQAVWAYVIATGELCRLTSENEMGMLPFASKRTVVWYKLPADSDVLRYKIITDDELYPGGLN